MCSWQESRFFSNFAKQNNQKNLHQKLPNVWIFFPFCFGFLNATHSRCLPHWIVWDVTHDKQRQSVSKAKRPQDFLKKELPIAHTVAPEIREGKGQEWPIRSPLFAPSHAKKELNQQIMPQIGNRGYQQLIKTDYISNTAHCLNSLKMFFVSQSF